MSSGLCQIDDAETTTTTKERIENAVSATRKMEENGGDENKSERMEREERERRRSWRCVSNFELQEEEQTIE